MRRMQVELCCVLAVSLGMVAPTLAVQLDGRLYNLGGAQVVWQLPASSTRVKGLLLAFHGCSHSSTDFWPRGPSCDACIGLPEELLITSTALGRGWAVMAISSADRLDRRCWAVPLHPQDPTADSTAVVAAVTAFVQQHRQQLQGVPLLAVGASSGGAFVLTLPHFLAAAGLQLSGVCSQISALPAGWMEPFLQGATASASKKQPPVLHVHMPRDTHTATAVAEAVKLRQKLGLSTHVIEVPPRPVTPELLSRVHELRSGQAAEQVVALLKKHGLLDEQGMLTLDPRHTHWPRIVRDSSIPGVEGWALTPDKSGLSEVLNMAYAKHELIGNTTGQMLDWFEQQQQHEGSGRL